MDNHRKAPENAPDIPPEATGTRWLPIAEVETLIGKRERNARYWLERHAIPWQGERPKLFSEQAILTVLENVGWGHRKAPEHPPERLPEYPPESTGTSDDPIEAVYRVLPEDLERAITRTGERYVGDIQTVFDQVAALYEQRLAEKDALIATVREEKDALIAELRRRAEAAETERDALRHQAAPQPLQQASPLPTHRDTPDAPAPAGGLWARVRRVFGGE
jgi:hypothetical protein